MEVVGNNLSSANAGLFKLLTYFLTLCIVAIDNTIQPTKTFNMKNLKFLSILALFSLLMFLFPNQATSQIPVRPYQLNDVMWIAQNPVDIKVSDSFLLSNGKFTEMQFSYYDGSSSKATGTYKYSNSYLTLYFDDGDVVSFTVKWVTPYKMVLLSDNGGRDLYYSQFKSQDDVYSREIMSVLTNNSSGYSGSYGNSGSREECPYCIGFHGQCSTCHGDGLSRVPDYSGTRTHTPPCEICGGTGKCKHCNGSGRK